MVVIVLAQVVLVPWVAVELVAVAEAAAAAVVVVVVLRHWKLVQF